MMKASNRSIVFYRVSKNSKSLAPSGAPLHTESAMAECPWRFLTFSRTLLGVLQNFKIYSAEFFRLFDPLSRVIFASSRVIFNPSGVIFNVFTLKSQDPCYDDLRCGTAISGIVHLVLYRDKEVFRNLESDR